MANKLTAIGCFAVGAGVGAALGLLFAPRAGKHTRARLCTTANRTVRRVDDMREDVRAYMSELVEEVSETVASSVGAYKQTAEAGGERIQQTLDKVREHIDKGRQRVEEYVRAVAE